MTQVSESEYHALCDSLFSRIENMLDDSGIDFDSNGSVVEADLDRGGKIIINRQPAAREVWLASPNGGHHFRIQDGQWMHTRNGREFFDMLAEMIA